MSEIVRPSTSAKLELRVNAVLIVIVGFVFLLGGGIGAARVLERGEPGHVDHALIYLFLGIAIFGALMLPGVFTMVKPILIFVFPNGIPVIGGKRRDDPPAPTPDTP